MNCWGVFGNNIPKVDNDKVWKSIGGISRLGQSSFFLDRLSAAPVRGLDRSLHLPWLKSEKMFQK
jgi:hypothetical protein